MKIIACCTAVAAITALATATSILGWALWEMGYLDASSRL